MSIATQEFGSIPDLIRGHARERPAHTALIHDEARLDFAALDALMDRVAAALQRDGLGPGDAIAIAAPTSIPYVATYLGAVRAGVTVVPLPLGATEEAQAAMLADSGARKVTLDEAWPAWLAPPGAAPRPVELAPDGVFNIIYSSGTTGVPKGIEQSHRMRWAHVRRGGGFGYGPDAVTLISTPLYSNTTLVSLFPALALGGAAVLMTKFDAGAFLALAERHRVTHAMLVPVQFQRLVGHPDFARRDLSSFRMKTCTSAPFSAALKAEVLARWPGGLVEYYGLTEGGGTTILAAHLRPDKLDTVGQPAEGHDIRVISDDGRALPAGEVGEVVGHSPLAMMIGYHNRPDDTARAEWRDPNGKRFLRTGDLGRFDEEGFLTLVGRKKDLIISGGFNVYPADLEAVLVAHPAVAEAAVVGVPSERWGETPVGFVVLSPGRGAAAGELLEWSNARLGKTQRLSAVEIVTELPRNAIGKVLKRQLRQR